MNITVVLGVPDQPEIRFQCPVWASRVANFEWTFTSASYFPNTQPTVHQITNKVGALDIKYSVFNDDYSSVLIIEDVQFSDAGTYTCIASIGDRISPITAANFLSVQGRIIILHCIAENIQGRKLNFM